MYLARYLKKQYLLVKKDIIVSYLLKINWYYFEYEISYWSKNRYLITNRICTMSESTYTQPTI